jgi:hypothetical protein
MNPDKYIELIRGHLRVRDGGHKISIQYRNTSGICVSAYKKYDDYTSIQHIYFGHIHFGKYYDWYINISDIKINSGNLTPIPNVLYYLIYSNDRCAGDIINVEHEDSSIYTDMYNYGILEDMDHFIKILRLFLVVSRAALSINRLAFLDISVKTE